MDRFRNTRQPDWEWWEKLWPEPAETLRTLGLRPRRSVADVGSGDGYFTLPAAELVDGAPVYAIDLDDSLLADLAAAADARDLPNVHCVHGDARDLADLLPEPVDVVLVANTLHGVEDEANLVAQAREAVRPGGRFVVVNWRDLPKSETTVGGAERGPPEELRMPVEETREVVAAEFDHVEEIDLPPYHYAVVGER